MSDEYLVHHGVKGMRWGVITKQYIPKGSSTPSSKKEKTKHVSKIQQRVMDRLSKRRNAKIAKRQKKFSNKKVSNQTSKEAETVEQKKQRIVATRSPKTISQNFDLFTTQELRDIYNRFDAEQKISNLAPKDVNSGEQFMKRMKDTEQFLNTVSNISKSAVSIYANVNSLDRMMNESKKGSK